MTHKEHIRPILDRLRANKFQAYIVGGAVRDIMLHRIPDDVDILTNAGIEQLKHLFSDQKAKIVGKSFPVILVNNIEISTGRTPFNACDFPESDLGGRDFTINAMAFDLFEKKILDPFNGRKDLEDAVIRFTKDPEKRIAEDPVRMIRACRFLAMIQGSFSLSTLDAILAGHSLLDDTIAKERIRHEIIKAMGLERPSLFFKALKQTRLLSKIFPSMDRCYDLDGGPHHGETVFEHCMLVGDALPARQPILRLAGFLHDTGKYDAACVSEGKLTFIRHEDHTRAMQDDLSALRFSQKEMAYITSLIKVHMRPLTDRTTPKAARRLLSILDSQKVGYPDFMRMRIADKKGNLAKRPYTFADIRARLEKLTNEIKAQSAIRINDLNLSGNEIGRILGVGPGPDIGRVKKILFEKILEAPELNTENDLKNICRSLKIKK